MKHCCLEVEPCRNQSRAPAELFCRGNIPLGGGNHRHRHRHPQQSSQREGVNLRQHLHQHHLLSNPSSSLVSELCLKTSDWYTTRKRPTNGAPVLTTNGALLVRVGWVPAVRWRNNYFPRNKEALPCYGRGPSCQPLDVQSMSDGSCSLTMLTTPRREHQGGGRR